MPKPSHRERLLDAGLTVMFRQCYVGQEDHPQAIDLSIAAGIADNK